MWFAYLDNIIVIGSKIEEQNKNMITLFERLRQTGLKFQTDRCELLKHELEYLGHIIIKDGVKNNNKKKLNAVENWN